MSFLMINPLFRSLLTEEHLQTVEQFLDQPGVVVSGHPDRHVLRVQLGDATAYLKREHRIPWRERLANAFAGFGFVSKSVREAKMLASLARFGIGCPPWLAAGESRDGRAFLLLGELTGYVDLREYLADLRGATPGCRRQFARRLGQVLAGVHEAGFDHPDLYSKHVLVHPGDQSIAFLDWQRSCLWPEVLWPRRCRDLAALDATLADGLATKEERLLCLRAYLHAVPSEKCWRQRLETVAEAIHRTSASLRQRRRIREMLQPPVASGEHNLVWLDGEALCVTPEFKATLGTETPSWLRLDPAHGSTRPRFHQTTISLPGSVRGVLTHRRCRDVVGWLTSWVRPRQRTSPELEQAVTLFRLQRFGVRTPRLLAFGQRRSRLGVTDSFLLTEALTEAMPLADWLDGENRTGLPPCTRRLRWQVLRATGRLVRQVHDAGCRLGYLLDCKTMRGDTLFLQARSGQEPSVVVNNLERIRRRRHLPREMAFLDLAALRCRVASTSMRRTDELRFLLAYLGEPHLTPALRDLIRGSILEIRC